MATNNFSTALSGWALLCTLSVQLLSSPVDQKAPKDVIGKAIQAHGGKPSLARLASYQLKAKGTIYAVVPGRKDTSPVTFEYWYQDPNRNKYILTLEFEGQQLTMTRVFNGQKGWRKLNNKTEDLSDIALVGVRQAMYENKVSRLYPLLDEPIFTLTPLSPEQIGGRMTDGVKVAAKGQNDIRLFFDKETSLLVKIVSLQTDDDGKEALREVFLTAQKDFGGLKQFTKYTRFLDGKKNIELQRVELRLNEKIDPQVFARP